MSALFTSSRSVNASVKIPLATEGALVTAMAGLNISEAEFVQQAVDHALASVVNGIVLKGSLVESLADAQNTRRALMERVAFSITVAERIIADQQAVSHRLLSAVQKLANT